MKSQDKGDILAPSYLGESTRSKTEQNRVVAWRLKLLRQANDLPIGVAQTCAGIRAGTRPSPRLLSGRRSTAQPNDRSFGEATPSEAGIYGPETKEI